MAASLFMPSSVSSIIYPLFLLFAFFSVYWLSSFLEFHMCAIASLMQINWIILWLLMPSSAWLLFIWKTYFEFEFFMEIYTMQYVLLVEWLATTSCYYIWYSNSWKWPNHYWLDLVSSKCLSGKSSTYLQ